MDYKRVDDTVYLRIDKDEEILTTILAVCKQERILTAWVQGIGACGSVTVSTYLPENNSFTDHSVSGMLELVSLAGNITMERDGTPFQHCHGIFSYLDKQGHPSVLAGHVASAVVNYTVEVVLTVAKTVIGRMTDSKTGIDVWDLR